VSGRGGRIVAVSLSAEKGTRKANVARVTLTAGHGLEGDAHAGPWHRQVSLLAAESIAKMTARGLTVGPGDFAENLTTEGIELAVLPVGTRLRIGGAVGEGAGGGAGAGGSGTGVLLEVTQIGKECHARCAIFHQAGDCVMPREGIFARVIRGGVVAVGDEVEVMPSFSVGVLTASDRGARGERDDVSGKVIAEMVASIGGRVTAYRVAPDDLEALKAAMIEMADRDRVSLLLTTGGTGLSPRDNTPEATLGVVERLVPGMAEAIRAASLKITPRAMLSRAVAGIRGRTLIINLPGSPKAVRECLEVVLPALPHGLEVLSGGVADCGLPS
jgi:molybdopterin adenylyltransferase